MRYIAIMIAWITCILFISLLFNWYNTINEHKNICEKISWVYEKSECIVKNEDGVFVIDGESLEILNVLKKEYDKKQSINK